MSYFDITNEVYDLEDFQITIKSLTQNDHSSTFSCSLHRNIFKVSLDKGVYNYTFPKHFEQEMIRIYVKSAMDIIEWNIAPKRIVRDKSICAISILRL